MDSLRENSKKTEDVITKILVHFFFKNQFNTCRSGTLAAIHARG